MSAPVPNYVHKATYSEPGPRQRPDGDTFRLRLDLGTYQGVPFDPIINIRLQGIDVVEYTSPRGKEATAFTVGLLKVGPVVVATEKPVPDVTLGRSVAHVWVGDRLLADLLREAGFEKP